MRPQLSTLTVLGLLALAVPAHAQTATKITQNNAWGTYSYTANNAKVCYVLSVPTAKTPEALDHGDIFFFVTQKPGQNVALEPQFIAGYNLKENSKVTVTIGNANFSMFVKGNSAWMENPAQEPQLVQAMRGGQSMSVKATSGRGNSTGNTISLKGVSAALTSLNNCK